MKARYVTFFLILMIPALIPGLFAQEVTKSRPVFGVRYTANYASLPTRNDENYRVLSSIPSVFVEFNNHFDLHIGMVYAHLFNPHWVEYVSFEPDAFGLTMGCKLTTIDHIKNFRLMGQTDVSATKVGHRITNSHFQERGPIKELLWALNLSLGADYQINNRIHIFTGSSVSFISPDYNTLNEMMLSLFLGVDYRFGTIKKR